MTNQTTLTDNDEWATNRSGSDALPMTPRPGLGKTFDGDRDVYSTLGYDEDLTVQDYWERYLRQDIARTVVDAPSAATWKERPEIVDDENAEEKTQFETDIQTLFREHELQSRLDAVDRLAGIGHFGVLVIGVRDGRPLEDPVNADAVSGPEDLAYLMPIAEDRVEDWDLVDDDTDERFGLPEQYEIDFSQRDRLGNSATSLGDIGDENVRTVHHSRVIHVPAGNTLDNMLMGRPRMEAVYNRLQDLEKVVGASSEMLWRAADYGLAIKADPDHAGDLNEADRDRLEDELQAWFHGLQPFLRLSGFDVEKLGGENSDPTGVFESLIKLIAGETRIPQRILTGSERGELASTQDRANWLSHISERQTNFAEPKILRPLIDRFVEFGVISPPAESEDDTGADYTVNWPNLFELSDVERAEVAVKLSKALNNARDPATSGQLMTPGEIRAEVFDLDPEVGAEVDTDQDPLTGDDGLADLLPTDPDAPEEGGDDDAGDEPPEEGEDDEIEQITEQFDLSSAITADD